MSAADLIAQLRAAGDPVSLAAAAALLACSAELERRQERIYQLEAIARLNADTIRGMQQAAAQIASAQWSRDDPMNPRTIHNNGDFHASRQSRSAVETR